MSVMMANDTFDYVDDKDSTLATTALEPQDLHQQSQSTNLFPKISGKHGDFLSQLRYLKNEGRLPNVLDLEGTVKLHGMHADIVYNLSESSAANKYGSKISFQSRNRVCAPDEDQHGWPRCISQFPEALIYLKDSALSVFRRRNPGVDVDTSLPLMIAGEWIGGRVQKEVGVAQLSNRLVILSVQINGVWQRDSDYRDLKAEKAGIYNIFVCGSQVVKFDTADISNANPTLLELQRLADAVEASCPFAAKFGFPNARGEGIVWKPGIPEGRADSKYWLKTKGPICGKENRIDPSRIKEDQVRNLTVTQAVARWVTPRRIEQGFEYLLEMDLEPTRDSLKLYMNWLVNDIVTEESTEIAELRTRHGSELDKTVKAKVGYAARDAYLREMERSGVFLA